MSVQNTLIFFHPYRLIYCYAITPIKCTKGYIFYDQFFHLKTQNSVCLSACEKHVCSYVSTLLGHAMSTRTIVLISHVDMHLKKPHSSEMWKKSISPSSVTEFDQLISCLFCTLYTCSYLIDVFCLATPFQSDYWMEVESHSFMILVLFTFLSKLHNYHQLVLYLSVDQNWALSSCSLNKFYTTWQTNLGFVYTIIHQSWEVLEALELLGIYSVSWYTRWNTSSTLMLR